MQWELKHAPSVLRIKCQHVCSKCIRLDTVIVATARTCYGVHCTLKSGLLSSHFLVLRLIVQLKSESKCTSVAVPQRKKHQMLACISGRLQRGRLTSESTSSRLLAVTSDQRRPKGKTRKWPGMSGTAAVKWLLMPSLKPREWQSL